MPESTPSSSNWLVLAARGPAAYGSLGPIPAISAWPSGPRSWVGPRMTSDGEIRLTCGERPRNDLGHREKAPFAQSDEEKFGSHPTRLQVRIFSCPSPSLFDGLVSAKAPAATPWPGLRIWKTVLTPDAAEPKSRRQAPGWQWQGGDLKVRSYGKLADLLGHERHVQIDLPCSVAEVRQRLAVECPEAAEPLASRRVMVCVGDTIVPDSHIVGSGEEIEILAPVSGG